VIDYLNALERLDVLVPRPDGGWGAVEVKLDGEELIAGRCGHHVLLAN
jgi:hypothetical protein